MNPLESKLLQALKDLVNVVEVRDNPQDEGCDSNCDEMVAARNLIELCEKETGDSR